MNEWSSLSVCPLWWDRNSKIVTILRDDDGSGDDQSVRMVMTGKGRAGNLTHNSPFPNVSLSSLSLMMMVIFVPFLPSHPLSYFIASLLYYVTTSDTFLTLFLSLFLSLSSFQFNFNCVMHPFRFFSHTTWWEKSVSLSIMTTMKSPMVWRCHFCDRLLRTGQSYVTPTHFTTPSPSHPLYHLSLCCPAASDNGLMVDCWSSNDDDQHHYHCKIRQQFSEEGVLPFYSPSPFYFPSSYCVEFLPPDFY